MPAKDDITVKKRVTRKLTKRRKEGHQVTMEIPKRFDDGDDADEDCTAPKGHHVIINQSVFGMIAAAGGSQVDFNARFEGQSSDEEEEDAMSEEVARTPEKGQENKKGTAEKKPQKKFMDSKLGRSLLGRSKSKSSPRGHHFPSLVVRSSSASKDPSKDSGSDDSLDDTAAPASLKGAPIMSQMLEAKAEYAQRPSFDSRRSGDMLRDSDAGAGSSSLAMRLMEIFQFESPEDVIEEYPCWLLKSVLLQGYMYITTKHICFYAYLPKKSNVVAKSGYLSKRGSKNPKYNRYWFRLQGDVLSYYVDPSDLYFPSGNIDLRYGISANIADREKFKDGTYFEVVTHQRKYHFRADSAPSAKEWVKALQKIIFRSHNDGDSVKISLPVENVIDVEDSQVVEFAETCKIRVIDNDETYAIDEYFFSFFSFGKEALNVLKLLVEDSTAQQIPEDVLAPFVNLLGANSPKAVTSKQSYFSKDTPLPPIIPPVRMNTPILGESVKATLSPLLSSPIAGNSPRASGDYSRASFDIPRRDMSTNRRSRLSMDLNRFNLDGPGLESTTSNRSFSRSRLSEKKNSEKQDSSDSFVHSLEDPESSAHVASASEDTQGSASQILRGSEVFFQPTIQRSASASRQRDQTPLANTQILSPTPVRMSQPKPRNAATTSVRESFRNEKAEPSVSAPSLQSIVKAGSYPLQRAAGFAGYLNRHSKRMSNLLATESMGYVEKVSGMWKGGKKHYDEPVMGLDDESEDEPEEDGGGTKNRFRQHFALPESEQLQATYFGYLHRVLPLYGKVYISNRSFCFRSMLPGTRTKLILPLKDIENVDKEKGFRFGYSGLVIIIKGHEELFFEFGQADTRDDCAVTLLQSLETIRFLKETNQLNLEETESQADAVREHRALQEARLDGHAEHDLKLPQSSDSVADDSPPILFDDPRASILNFKPSESLKITCLTIGSRGDVQPYIALCKGLIAEGHKPTIATHVEFKDWVESHGIIFKPVDGDPAELMRICVENGMFTYSFLREASATFRTWIDDLLSSSWKACQGADILIESPSAMAGIHIAEALGIPYFRAFTMPWTRTRAYPHAFAVPEHKMGGAYNYITYVMFDNVFWKAIAGQVNRWRKKELGLQRTNLEKMQPNKVPFLYNFSPSVVVPPLDYSDWIRVTGYWFLDEGPNFKPPKELTDFIAKARADGKKLVYIGFGSIVVADSNALTRTIVASVLKADVRCILSKGWSDRFDKASKTEPEVPMPVEIFQIKSAPHDWLFTQVDAAAHHGGSGTTGASLRAGLPTIIKPFFGDQFFYGSRVEDLGVGIYLRKLNVSVFARALWEAVNSERIIIKARVLGEQIRKEDGVATAIQCIYRDLEYAKSLIKRKDGKPEETAEEPEESWTFIGDDGDPELIRRIHYDMGKDSASASTSTGGPGRGTEMPVRGTKI